MLVAQCAHSSSLHDQTGLGERPADPSDCKRPQNVPVADDHNVARDILVLGLPYDRAVVLFADLGDQTVHAADDVLGTLAAGTAVAPDVPRPQPFLLAHLPDLGRRDAFVLAVVPLRDARFDRDTGVGFVFARALRGSSRSGGSGGGGMRFLPGVRVVAAEIEEFEGSLGAVAWRDVSSCCIVLVRGTFFFYLCVF